VQINHFNKTYLKYFSFIIFFICIFIVSLEVYNNINFITDLIALNFKYVHILLVLQFFFLFLYSYRFFFSYNFFLKKKIKFSHWTYFFFKSLIYNNLLNFLGTVYRALFLKKRGISYVKSTGILYLLYFSYLFLSLFLILFGTLFFTNLILVLKILFILFSLAIFFFIYFLKKIITFIIKRKILAKITYSVINEFFIFKNYSKKKSLNNFFILNLFGNGAILFVIEIFIFFFAYRIFFSDSYYSNIFLLFAILFILDKIPFIGNIIGVSEILYGFIFVNVGLDFYQGVVIKLICRVTGIIALVASYAGFLIFQLGIKSKTIKI
jgi:uncharacterized membrane protein YbhN (UPF0104 family)